jgi:hypothetical protein
VDVQLRQGGREPEPLHATSRLVTARHIEVLIEPVGT